MKLGFLYSESLTGTFYPLDAPSRERAGRLAYNVRIRSVADFVKDRLGALDGSLSLEGFADDVPVSGTVAFRWLDQYRLPYDIALRANDGAAYTLRGQRSLHILRMRDSVSTLVASVYDATGREVIRANLRFDARADLRKLLGSFRLTYRGDGVA